MIAFAMLSTLTNELRCQDDYLINRKEYNAFVKEHDKLKREVSFFKNQYQIAYSKLDSLKTVYEDMVTYKFRYEMVNAELNTANLLIDNQQLKINDQIKDINNLSTANIRYRTREINLKKQYKMVPVMKGITIFSIIFSGTLFFARGRP
jgi:hypothetical protein